MLVCACVMTWLGWFNSPTEALAVCLDRRGLPESVMCPSQLRYLFYFESLLQGNKPSPDAMVLSAVEVAALPDAEDGSCSPFIEVIHYGFSYGKVYNQNKLVFSSFVPGSKTKGTITALNAKDSAVFHLAVTVRGNVMIRCRHLSAAQGKPVTLFRCQFYTGFVKLFQLNLNANDLDASVALPAELKCNATFTPAAEQAEVEDPYEQLIVSESSSLWSEVLKKKESRGVQVEGRKNAFVVGNIRSSKRDSGSENERGD